MRSPTFLPSQSGYAVPPEAHSEMQPASAFRTNDAAIEIIKQSEGLRLEAYAVGGQWLIGYGHSRTAKAGMRINEDEAEALLREDLADCEQAVANTITVPVTENMFGALVSLCYNLGAGGFAGTSVVSALNEGDYGAAGDNFLNHDRARIDGVLQSVPHLTERRKKERALFLAP